MDEITIHGRVTSGVKMINLDKGVTVAQIAKVRETISGGDHDIDNIDEVPEEIEDDNKDNNNNDEE
jgi:DNA gyrase subunit A